MLKLEMPTLKEVLEEIGGNEQLLKELLNKLRLWLKQQLHLPQDISDQRLQFFIYNAKFNLQRAKENLDSHYTLRNLIPEIFADLDPLSDSMIEIRKRLQWLPVPKLTPNKDRLIIGRFLDSDDLTFDMWTVFKYAIVTLEIRVEEDIAYSNVIIIDCLTLRIGHILKFTLNMLKKIDAYLESYGVKVEAIHIINIPHFFDLIMTLIKAAMRAEILNRIHLYTSGIESLYGIIPKSILPEDYGGEQPSMNDIAEMWYIKLAKQRDWLLKQEKLTADESLRSNSIIKPHDLFGVSGTFQKLEID